MRRLKENIMHKFRCLIAGCIGDECLIVQEKKSQLVIYMELY